MIQGAASDVHIAPSPIATPAMAPENSLSVAACAVPCPCEIVPSANPRESGWVIARRSISQGLKLAPIMPVMTTKAAVKVGFPWTILAISTAIGTVGDLIAIEDASFWVNPNNCANASCGDHSTKRSSEQADNAGNDIFDESLAVFVKGYGESDGGGAEQRRHDVLCRLVGGERDSGRQQHRDDNDGAE